MNTSHPLKADLLMVMVTLLAAAGWLFSREALDGLPPLLFIGSRFLLAGMVLGVAGWRDLSRLDRDTFFYALKAGALFAVAMMLWVSALFRGTHLGEGAFLTSLGVVMVPITGALFFRERPAASTWWALPVALAGLACLSLNHGFRIEASQALYFAAAFLFSIHFNLNTRMTARIPVLALTSLQLLVVGAVALPVSAMLETWPTQVNSDVVGWAFASAFIATSVRFLLQTHAQKLSSASHAAVILILEPVWTSIIGAFWFAERMTSLQLTGCALIFGALLITRLRVLKQMMLGEG
jgi:drug/metabolite transporter (DMT)-like permease